MVREPGHPNPVGGPVGVEWTRVLRPDLPSRAGRRSC